MNSQKSIAVLILAAGSIKNKYQSFSFIYNSPALVPIASRSSISFILDFYDQQPCVNLYIAINKEDEELFKKELAYYNHINLIAITQTTDVCNTLLQAIDFISEQDIIVNLTTTIPTQYPNPNEVFLDKNLSNHNYYSGVVFSDTGISFKTKTDKEISAFNAFTGVFRTNKILLRQALSTINNGKDLLDVVKQLHEIEKLHYPQTDWIDTGHEINYAQARSQLISSRSFNAITVDSNTGILTKKSSNEKKLLQEKRYITMLPAELQIRYPRILISDNQLGIMQMEYYGYPNLSEYQLYRSIEPLWWERIFDGLAYSLQVMQQYHFSIGIAAYEAFYLHKNLERINTYLTTLPVNDVFNEAETLIINGTKCTNINYLLNAITTKIKSMYNENDFCVMHGDFCFNNILFDTFSNTMKLIDPRGSFGEQCVGIYGDRKYDLAKLIHSSLGHYDYIVNNLFQIEEHGNEINYSFPLRNNHVILEQLSTKLLQQTSADQNNIMFITGLLFLSMCPLHADNARRQRLMFAHGILIINKYI